MSNLDLIATVNVDATSVGLTRMGFGTLLIAVYHTLFPGGERVRAYSDLDAMVTDGFTTTSPGYLAAEKAFAQNPRPPQIKIGRRDLPFTQTLRLTPSLTTTGVKNSIKVSKGTQSVTVNYTNGGAETIATLCGIYQTQIAAAGITGLTATNNTTHVTLTCTVGQMAFLSDWANIKVEDLTADPGIATDLAAIAQYDDDWYGLALDSRGKLESEEAADWIATQIKISKVATSDWQATDLAQTTDIQSVLKAKTYFRTECYFDRDNTAGYSDVAALAKELTMDPGSYTMAFKNLTGVTVDKLTSAEIANLKTKGYSYYISVSGANMTLGGKSAGGEWVDTIRGLDWLKVRMQERIVAVKAGNKKIPFTDGGIGKIGAEVRGQLSDGITAGLLAEDPPPLVSLPLASSIPTADKQARTLNGIKFSATLAGAIHFTSVQGSVSA